MDVSKHAIERLRERLPRAKDWSEDVLIRRLKDSLDTAIPESFSSTEGNVVWSGQIKSSATYSVPLKIVVRNNVIVTVYL